MTTRVVLLGAVLLAACALHIHREQGDLDVALVHGRVTSCDAETPTHCTTTEAGPLDAVGLTAFGSALASIIGALAMLVA